MTPYPHLDAERGSAMLRDAILRARGFHVPEPTPPKLPRFKRPARPKGRPKGRVKIRAVDPRIVQIMALSAQHYGVDVAQILSRRGAGDVVRARKVAMYVARRATPASFPDIALHFDGRDHTTIVDAVQGVEKLIAKVDRRTLEALNAIHEALEG